jgi:hypothetical protein
MARETWGGYLVNLSWLAGFLVGIYGLGYILSIPVFVLAYMRWLGTRWRGAVFSSIVSTVFIYAVFEIGLELELHRGLLFVWLGY